jgi:hypothetical protein
VTAPTVTRKLATTPDEALTMAAAVVTKRGLCQNGWLYDRHHGPADQRPVCTVGAIRVAVYGTDLGDPHARMLDRDELYDDAVAQLARHLGASGGPFGAVTEWSDDPATTRTQVVAALLAASGIRQHNFDTPGGG